jgi:hypothetical protein
VIIGRTISRGIYNATHQCDRDRGRCTAVNLFRIDIHGWKIIADSIEFGVRISSLLLGLQCYGHIGGKLPISAPIFKATGIKCKNYFGRGGVCIVNIGGLIIEQRFPNILMVTGLILVIVGTTITVYARSRL